MRAKKVILLDLNKTLAEEISCNFRTFTYNVEGDVYSKALSDAICRGFEIHLVTARTDNYQEETLAKIEKDLGLRIDVAVFKSYANRFKKVHDFKREYVERLLMSGEYVAEDFIAIESNFTTQREFEKLGIKSIYTRVSFLQMLAEQTGE